MTSESLVATITIDTPAETVFAVLADPASHAAVDGTGWVGDSRDGAPLTEVGQIFRMAMYHDNHPDGHYEIANQVEVLDPPRAIAWKPGQDTAGDGNIQFGGWIWRYDVDADAMTGTRVTLTYDWSAVPQPVREVIEFPPFGIDHLDNSLQNLAQLAGSPAASAE